MDAKTLTAAAYAAATMHTETECVHVHADGSVAVGTDGRSTQPTAWGDVVATYHPDRAADPWDCFEAAKEGEGDDEGTTTPCTYAEWCEAAKEGEEHPDDEGEGDDEGTTPMCTYAEWCEAAKEGEEHPDDEGEGDEGTTPMCTCAKVWGGDGGGPCGHEAEDCFVRYVPEYQRSTARAAGTRRGVWEKVEVSAHCWGAIADAIADGTLEDEWYEALPLV